MKKVIRLIEIQETIDRLTKEYATANNDRRQAIAAEYHSLNQEHCKLRATAYKTPKTK